MYIAHRREDKGKQSFIDQSVKEHCENTAELCSAFSIEPFKEIAHIIGIMHDIGKYQPKFQRRILKKDVWAPHALCGAQACQKLYGANAESLLMQFCIAGHHAGLPDGGTMGDTEDLPSLQATLKRSTESYVAYLQELSPPPSAPDVLLPLLKKHCTTREEIAETFAFIARYLYSCLTDADWLDTETFCTQTARSSLKADFTACLKAINERLSGFRCITPLQKARSELQQQAYTKVDQAGPIYLMNMPTGSGKTLCSMKFALERAIRMGKKRIIYVIPYNSIIDQTAAEFTRLFSDNAQILRHQSTYDYLSSSEKLQEEKENSLSYKLATENWDAQIIITTSVQFFESVYGATRGKLRKMHSMADSIIIFDEAHLMPVEYLQPCLRVIAYITQYLNSDAMFLTATMPDFAHLLEAYAMRGLAPVDLIPDKTMFSAFRKCKYSNLGSQSDETLVETAKRAPSALIVVNKRAGAKAIYALISEAEKYHLSTYMTGFDRERTIQRIQSALQRMQKDYPNQADVPPNRRVMVVSTSLIEAGVDLDFHTVYRELAGLDSILQAGGRCNREGRRTMADVYIFERAADFGKQSHDERRSLTKGLLQEFDDIACAESIHTYYQRLYFAQSEMITRNAMKCDSPAAIPFRSYARQFELIDNATVSVIVEQDETSCRLMKSLMSGDTSAARGLQKYAFTVYRYEFEKLLQQGVVAECEGGIFRLANQDYYTADTGVKFEGTDYYS